MGFTPNEDLRRESIAGGLLLRELILFLDRSFLTEALAFFFEL